MSEESSNMGRDVTLTSRLQTELQNVTQKDTDFMVETELRQYIRDVKVGLTALTQLPTTSRLNDLLKEKQSVKDAEARILALLAEGEKVVEERENLRKELILTQQAAVTAGGRIQECSHGDLQEKVRNLEE